MSDHPLLVLILVAILIAEAGQMTNATVKYRRKGRGRCVTS